MTEGTLSPDFWASRQCRVMVNPRDPQAGEEAGMLNEWISQQEIMAGHLLFATSGSTGIRKWAALSYDALLSSARVVNCHLNAGKKDSWLLALPDFHVGGIGVSARCHEAGSIMHTMLGKWDPLQFHQLAATRGITLTSLVPAQLYDLVHAGLKVPASLRAVLVGGGRLDDVLYERATALGWPVMETYGMTEAGSQIATAMPGSRDLYVLPAWQARMTAEKHLKIKGESLLTAYVSCDGGSCLLSDPKMMDGWFDTGDVVRLEADRLEVMGRADRCVKVLGELVSLEAIERELTTLAAGMCGCPGTMAVVAVPDSRCGSHLILCSDTEVITDVLLADYNRTCSPVNRVREVCVLDSIPRSELGKIIYPELGRAVARYFDANGQ